MNTSTKVGDTEYNNYYVSLLSRLDTQDTNNPYTKEYYELLKEIIEIRLSREKYDISMLQNEFDNLFHEIVNKYFKSPFNKLFYAMRTIKGDVTVADVEGWITEQQNDKQYNEYTQFAIKQMANIYMLIKNYNRYKVKTERKYTYKEGWKEIDSEGINNMFDLVKQENKKLEEFWSKVLSDYRNITIESLIEECKSIGDKVNQYAVWPCPSSLYIGGITYEHYLFGNPKGPVGEEPDEDLGIDYQTTPPEQPTSMEPPPYTQDDLNENDKDPSDTEPTPKDFRYWQRYFALATVISLPFLNCGLDIMPYVQLIPFPCIFICLTSVYIQMLDITIVFGLSIRGMYIWPIVLFVNLSNQYASILTPLIAQLKNLQSKLQAKVEALVEMPITAIADGYIKMLEEDNRRIRRENIQIRAYQTQIKIKKVKNQEKIKSDFNRVFNPKAKQTQHVIDPLDEDPENK